MKTKYGKKVYLEYTHNIYGKYISLIVLKEEDYWNIHIINDSFKDEELNTLDQQIPIDMWKLEEFTEEWVLETIYRHVIWDIGYPNADMVTVDALSIIIDKEH